MPAELSHYGWVWILALVAILAFALYRRGRRLIGRQRYTERRMLVRMGLLAVAIFLIAYSRVQRGSPPEIYAGMAVGFAIGVAIALVSLRLTRMGRDETGIWYVPNIYLGIGLIALLVARFAYEYVVVFPAIRRAAAAHGTLAQTGFSSPSMLSGVLFLVIGYYLAYYTGVYLRARRLEGESPPTGNGAGKDQDNDS